jgi:hypothetical protein
LSVRGKRAGFHAKQFPVDDVIERCTKPPMIVVLERDEPESLQYSVRHSLRGTENFRHPVDRPRLSLKGNFDKVALPQRLRQLQQAAGYGNGLEFRFCASAIF